MSDPQVLVVDDEEDIRILIQDILTDEDYGVTVAANAAEARAARAARKFDLILLDIWRHGRRGDAPRRIRLRREAAVTRQATAYRRGGAGSGRAPGNDGAQPAAIAARSGRSQCDHAGAARARAAICAA
jgi:CheY-like chemotaxis protein